MAGLHTWVSTRRTRFSASLTTGLFTRARVTGRAAGVGSAAKGFAAEHTTAHAVAPTGDSFDGFFAAETGFFC